MSKKPYKRPTKVYAGIGNRDTPPAHLALITSIAQRLASTHVLRSGAAAGADTAFMRGTMRAEIYVPWHNYEGFPLSYALPVEAYKQAQAHHPAWAKLSQGIKSMHARNMLIIAGAHMKDFVDFVVCFTRDGCESAATRSIHTGGTGSAIAFADENDVPVINLANPNSLDHLSIFSEIDFTDLDWPSPVSGF